VAQKLKALFKRSAEEADLNLFGYLWLYLVEVPLNFLRNYSIPTTDSAEWERTRAAILVVTTPGCFCYF